MSFYFYKVTNTINGKYYFGSGSKENYKGSGLLLKKAYKKYGLENFTFEKLKFFDNRNDAFKFEDRFLKIFKLDKNCMSYNLKNAGQGGDTISNHPDRDKIVKTLGRKGRTSNRKGILMSDEQKDKISISLKKSYDNNKRQPPIKKGSHLTNEHKNKISESSKGLHTGEQNGMYGKGKSVIINNVEYPSIRICADALKLHLKTVTYRINSASNKFKNWAYKQK